jgi:polyphosphate glucokinase
MLFLGLGTGLGSAIIAENVCMPLELAHMPYRKATFEDYVGERGLKRRGKSKWRKSVLTSPTAWVLPCCRTTSS